MDNETRIIKHGRFYNKVVRFKCSCGCVFETTDTKKTVMAAGNVVYTAYCPECDNIVTKNEWD